MKIGAIVTVMLIIISVTLTSTLAYFSDSEASTGNTFTDGTLDLKVRDDNEAWRDGVVATWTLANMKPGDERWGLVYVDRRGTLSADHLEIYCDYTVSEEQPVAEPDTDPNTDAHPDWMAKNMSIEYAHYKNGNYDINLLTGDNPPTGEKNSDWKIEDVDNDGKITLYDLKYSHSGNGVDNLPEPNHQQYTLKMRIKFCDSAGNDFQGDTLNLKMYFTLNQDASQ